MTAALTDLLHISHQVGRQVELVQGGGGNTSVKTAQGEMYIKASGTTLQAMSAERGWVKMDHNTSVVTQDNDGQLPSMEWPMHLLLPRVVIHVHAVYLNVYNCQVGGVAQLAELLKQFEPIIISYATLVRN